MFFFFTHIKVKKKLCHMHFKLLSNCLTLFILNIVNTEFRVPTMISSEIVLYSNTVEKDFSSELDSLSSSSESVISLGCFAKSTNTSG